MTKTQKILLLVAAVLIALGIGLAFGSMRAVDFRWSALDTDPVQEEVFYPEEPFDSIQVQNLGGDVEIGFHDGKECLVDTLSSQLKSYTVEVQDGVLFVTETEKQGKWTDYVNLDIGKQPGVTILLPEKEYKALRAESQSGDVAVTNALDFASASVICQSGDIRFAADVSDTLVLKTQSGEIEMNSRSCGKACIESQSGDAEVKNTALSGSLSVTTQSGEIDMENVTSQSSMTLRTQSGEIDMERCDAASLDIESQSGEVEATLLTGKTFDVESGSGEIDIPRTDEGGVCRIKTSSGDIRVRIGK